MNNDNETNLDTPFLRAAALPRQGLLTRRTLVKGVLTTGAAALLTELTGERASLEASPAPLRSGALREYWIQADAFERNLVPSSRDDVQGYRWEAADSTYWAVGFRAYTPHWGRPLQASRDIGENSGIPGPVIRGQPGDQIKVHFRNNDTHYGFPHSIHTHGLLYREEMDGAWMSYTGKSHGSGGKGVTTRLTGSGAQGALPGTAIYPGETYTYEYTVLPDSVGSWVYHDHSIPQAIGGGAPVMDIGTQLGMFGLIAIEGPATPPIDREIFLFFHQLYAADIPSLAQDFACFNGYAFSPNTPAFQANTGERVRWRIGALGQEFYVFHLHGHRWQSGDGYTDTAILGPATTATLEYVEDNPGRWFYHCTVPEHVVAGMTGLYIVNAQ